MTFLKGHKVVMVAIVAALVLGALPLPADAARLVAAVLTSDMSRYREAHRAFVKTLAQKGFDQSNTEIIIQTPNADPISWANSIRKFKAIGADIIVTYGAPVTLAAMREAVDFPIIFIDVYGPVETGISRSLSRSGANMTGVSSKVPLATLVNSYREIKPLKNLGVIYSSREVGSVVQLKEIKRVAALQGFSIIEANVLSPATLDTALATLLSQVDCIYLSEGSTGARNLEKIITKAMAAKVPVISQIPDSSEKGALITLEANPAEQGQLAGEYAVKIFSGKSPAQMPISTPKRVELVINLRTAKLLELTVPFQALGSASRVIK